jgi:ankyrin repeat protein
VCVCIHRYGADLDAKDGFGWTALMRAAYDGRREMVELLLEVRSDWAICGLY